MIKEGRTGKWGTWVAEAYLSLSFLRASTLSKEPVRVHPRFKPLLKK